MRRKVQAEYYRNRTSQRPRRQTDVAAAVSYNGRDVPLVSCVGNGNLAKQLTSLARRYGIPIRRNEDLAQCLERLGDDSAVPPELFEDIAAILAEVVPESELS